MDCPRSPIRFLVVLTILLSQATSAQSEDSAVLAHFRAGQRAAAAQQADAAIVEFQAALKLDPNLVQARANLGLMYYLAGRYEEAVAELSKAVKAAPDILSAQLFLGLSYLKLSQAAKALPPLQAAKQLDPANGEAARGLLACYRALGRYQDAGRMLRVLSNQLSSRNASQEDALYVAGQGYLQMGTQLTERLARKFPTSAWTHRLAGDLASDRGDWSSAEDSYRKALADNASMPGLDASLAAATQHAVQTVEPDETAKIVDRLEGAVTENPGSPEVLYRLIRAYTVLGDDCFRKLASQFPDSARAHQLQGEIFRLREDFAAAQKEFATAASMLPDEADIHQSLGETDLRLERLEEAKAELTKAAELSSGNAETQFLLGQVLLKLSDFEGAIAHLREAVRQDPNLVQAHALLGRALLRAEQPAAAIPELQRGVDVDYYGDLHFLLYQAYRAAGKDSLAQQALARSKELRKRAFANSVAKVGGEAGPPAE